MALTRQKETRDQKPVALKGSAPEPITVPQLNRYRITKAVDEIAARYDGVEVKVVVSGDGKSETTTLTVTGTEPKEA